jgi:hypothetical protein
LNFSFSYGISSKKFISSGFWLKIPSFSNSGGLGISSRFEPIPESFIDMITYELLEDPVIAEDNFIYSRNSLLDWFDGCAEVGEPITSPLTGRPMGTNMRPEPNLARLCLSEPPHQVD